ncbi:MAG: hypothetical protein OXC30_02875 [Alphaproteobacteria bacterium]|nr:hypothetical protein [Alphaproteobacteria bacterium]
MAHHKASGLLFLFCSLLIGQSQWRHTNIHWTLKHPFYLMAPNNMRFSHPVKIHKKGSINSEVCGKLSAFTPIPFYSSYLPSHGFVHVPQKGFVGYDLSAPKDQLVAEKTSCSTIILEKKALVATLTYTTNTHWQLSISEGANEIFKRSNKKNPKPITASTRIGLFDIVPNITQGHPAGWLVAINGSVRLCIPYVEKGKTRIWSEGFSTLDSQKAGFIFQHNADGSLDIWQETTIATRKNAPLKSIALPMIARIYLHPNKPPTVLFLAPPNNIEVWPKDAQVHFSDSQKFIASLTYGLPTLKKTSAQRLANQSPSPAMLSSLWKQARFTKEWLLAQKAPLWLKNPLIKS